jgi:cytochrome c2
VPTTRRTLIRPLALASLMILATAVAAVAQDRELVETGRTTFVKQGCHGCHTIGKIGTPIGPDLSHVGAKYRAEYLARWLRDPAYLRPSTHMPAIELTEEDIRALAAFLAAQQ